MPLEWFKVELFLRRVLTFFLDFLLILTSLRRHRNPSGRPMCRRWDRMLFRHTLDNLQGRRLSVLVFIPCRMVLTVDRAVRVKVPGAKRALDQRLVLVEAHNNKRLGSCGVGNDEPIPRLCGKPHDSLKLVIGHTRNQ